MNDFSYISKYDDEVKKLYYNIIDILYEVQDLIRDKFTFSFTPIGSYSRNMITYDKKTNVGFDFENANEVIDRLKSEISELEAAISEHSDIKIEEELGDILFSCTNLSRFLKKDSEKALTFAINKFIIRFSSVEALLEADGKSFSDATQDELNNYWEKAKKNTVI